MEDFEFVTGDDFVGVRVKLGERKGFELMNRVRRNVEGSFVSEVSDEWGRVVTVMGNDLKVVVYIGWMNNDFGVVVQKFGGNVDKDDVEMVLKGTGLMSWISEGVWL